MAFLLSACFLIDSNWFYNFCLVLHRLWWIMFSCTLFIVFLLVFRCLVVLKWIPVDFMMSGCVSMDSDGCDAFCLFLNCFWWMMWLLLVFKCIMINVVTSAGFFLSIQLDFMISWCVSSHSVGLFYFCLFLNGFCWILRVLFF